MTVFPVNYYFWMALNKKRMFYFIYSFVCIDVTWRVCNCVFLWHHQTTVLSWQICVTPNDSGDWRLTCAFIGIQTTSQLLQQSCPCRISLVFLAFVVLLCHQWVVEPGTTQAAVLARLAVIGQRLPRGRGRVCGLRGGRGWLCTEQNIHSSSINIHQYRWAYEPIQYQNKQ